MSSGFRSVPPKVRLRELDSVAGSAPYVLRSGDVTGKTSGSFDDTRTIIFESESNVLLSVGLPSGSRHINTQVPRLISTTANVRKGLADKFLTGSGNGHIHSPFKEDWRPEQSTASFYSGSQVFDRRLSSKSSFTINIANTREQILTRSPKRTNNVFDPAGRFYNQDLTGFCYYNASTRRWDQIGLVDPETGADRVFDYRFDNNDGGFGTAVVSGTDHFPMQFCSLNQFMNYQGDGETYESIPKYFVSGIYPNGSSSQFSAEYRQTLTDRFAKIPATPTCMVGAPFYNLYHATASQRIQMSNYINRPFMLEKVVVNLKLAGEKTGSRTDRYSTYDRWQDDVVFFLYRQLSSPWDVYNNTTRNARSRREFVTSSERFLICSGVASFYDGYKRYTTSSWIGGPYGHFVDTFTPFNSPSFSHDWGFSQAQVNASGSVIKTFAGDVEIRCQVAAASKNLLGEQWMAPTVTGLSPSLVFMNYWPGGSTCMPFGPTASSGKSLLPPYLTQPKGINQPQFGSYGYYPNTLINDGATLSSFEDAFPVFRQDPRLGTSFGETNNSTRPTETLPVTLTGQQSRPTSYVLMPNDELVFGLETTISPGGQTQFGTNGDVSYITGTLFKIQTGDMSITFYGEYLKAGEYDESIRFENATTPSVQNLIGEEIGDQVELRELSQVNFSAASFSMIGKVIGAVDSSDPLVAYRKRLTNLMTARMVTVAGIIISYDYLLNNIENPTTANDLTAAYEAVVHRNKWSFNKIFSKERYYDTLFPSFRKILVSAGAILTSSYVKDLDPYTPISGRTLGLDLYKFESATIATETGNSVAEANTPYFERTGDLHHSLTYIYASNETRVDESGYSVIVPLGTAGNYSEGLITGNAINWLLLARGANGHLTNVGGFIGILNSPSGKMWHHVVTGAWGTKYGVHSVVPQNTSPYFRIDRYGQNRDMMEQRKFGVFYVKDPVFIGKTDGPVTVKFFSGSIQTIPASASMSSNRSIEATSSLPFFDNGTYSNWGTVT